MAMDVSLVLRIFHDIFTIQRPKAVKYSFMVGAAETIINSVQKMNVNNFAWEKQLQVEYNLNPATIKSFHFRSFRDKYHLA